jgi:hypothetical protein
VAARRSEHTQVLPDGAETSAADYGDERWYIVSVIEFDGPRIARMTDYFGPKFPAPEWRREWVQLEDVTP